MLAGAQRLDFDGGELYEFLDSYVPLRVFPRLLPSRLSLPGSFHFGASFGWLAVWCLYGGLSRGVLGAVCAWLKMKICISRTYIHISASVHAFIHIHIYTSYVRVYVFLC